MATIKQYKKKDGSVRWMFQAYLGIDPTTRKSVKTTRRDFKTKKEAKKVLNKILNEFETKKYNDSSTKIKTFKQLYEIWFHQHSLDIKATTQQRIRIHFDKHILPKFGELSINSIEPLYCQKVLNKWASQLATYKQLRTYVNMVFKYGILIGVVKDNPMIRTVTPKSRLKIHKDEAESFYTKDELKEFFDCLERLEDKRAFTFFRVLAFLGLRKGEAMALQWKDIDFKNQVISIDKTLVELQSGKLLVQSTKTDSSNRTIRIDDRTASILKEWKNNILQRKLSLGIRNDNFEDNVVFSQSVLYREKQYLGKSYPNHVMAKVQKHFPDMKIIKVHDFRKTNASLLFESGASIKDVAQILGHKSTKTTTDIYVKVTPTKQTETVANFSKYMAF
ncbi:site-specific integrase [Enterococcus sp. AZ126]|uniref:site-specific integrase n=1 Tax=Enterococcus sp. AZ126 TaxID=2774635 RepID=UPI003F225CDD